MESVNMEELDKNGIKRYSFEDSVKNTIIKEDCVLGMAGHIPDESVDLVIADPPYFKVIGEKWDYQWRTEEEYIAWCDTWYKEVGRVTRLGGSFYLFGYFRTLAYLLPIIEKYGFKLRQQIILDKGIQAISGRATKNYKQFPCVTESILFFIKDPIPFSRNLLKNRQKELKIRAFDINEALGVKSNGGGMWSIYTGKNICEQLPTKEYWDKLQEVLQFEYPYEKISITFNTEMGITDVWRDIDFYGERKTRFHTKKKQLKLIEHNVRVSSNECDLVLDPFMGSGTTAVASKLNGRNYVGFEINDEYYDKSLERINASRQSKLY